MDIKELQNKMEKVVSLWEENNMEYEYDAYSDAMCVEYCDKYPVQYYIQPILDNGIFRDINNDNKPILDFYELGTIEEYIVNTFGLDENSNYPEYSED